MKKIVLAVGGASGAIYAKILMDRLLELRDQWQQVAVVMSENARLNWELELGEADLSPYPFTYYAPGDFMAPFASGSAKYDTMIICPCSMGLVGRIAQGLSTDLTTRAADVMLKERRRLILVPREAPYSLIHLQNMVQVTQAGGIICPASPSFYSQPQTVEAVVTTVVDRIIDLAGFEDAAYRWGEQDKA